MKVVEYFGWLTLDTRCSANLTLTLICQEINPGELTWDMEPSILSILNEYS